jgi:branched-chain amino acid aminotransferase
MLNFNGEFIPKSELNINFQNRAFKYGDAVFDTLKYEKNLYFIEEHYFRLMSSMRMLRMKIPMNFTLQFYKDEIIKTIKKNHLVGSVRIRVNIFRKEGGLYTPATNKINYLIEVEKLNNLSKENYEIELYKDFPVLSGLLSTIKTNNKIVNVLSSIFAEENNYDNCILINEKKNVVEVNNANIFLIFGNEIITPPLTEGCINGIVRMKIIEFFKDSDEFVLIEKTVSPFELLKADEIFLTNSIFEIQSVTKYRKKSFNTEKTQKVKAIFKSKKELI